MIARVLLFVLTLVRSSTILEIVSPAELLPVVAEKKVVGCSEQRIVLVRPSSWTLAGLARSFLGYFGISPNLFL